MNVFYGSRIWFTHLHEYARSRRFSVNNTFTYNIGFFAMTSREICWTKRWFEKIMWCDFRQPHCFKVVEWYKCGLIFKWRIVYIHYVNKHSISWRFNSTSHRLFATPSHAYLFFWVKCISSQMCEWNIDWLEYNLVWKLRLIQKTTATWHSDIGILINKSPISFVFQKSLCYFNTYFLLFIGMMFW